MINREAITEALFQKISATPGIKTASRRNQHWSDVTAPECPAMFLIQSTQTPRQMRGMPTVWTLQFEIAVYVKVGNDPRAVPHKKLNTLVDAIESMFTPDPYDNVQTLDIEGVSHCHINGPIELDDGVLGDTALAFIPVEVLTT